MTWRPTTRTDRRCPDPRRSPRTSSTPTGCSCTFRFSCRIATSRRWPGCWFREATRSSTSSPSRCSIGRRSRTGWHRSTGTSIVCRRHTWSISSKAGNSSWSKPSRPRFAPPQARGWGGHVLLPCVASSCLVLSLSKEARRRASSRGSRRACPVPFAIPRAATTDHPSPRCRSCSSRNTAATVSNSSPGKFSGLSQNSPRPPAPQLS